MLASLRAVAGTLGVTGDVEVVDNGAETSNLSTTSANSSWRIGEDARTVYASSFDGTISVSYFDNQGMGVGSATSSSSLLDPPASTDSAGETESPIISDPCMPPPGCEDTTLICPAVCAPAADAVWQPTLLEGLPSAAEAQAQAEKLFLAAGLDLSGATFEVSIDPYWGVWVSLETLSLDRYPMAGPFGSVAFGANGVIQSMYVRLAEWKRLGDYPLVSSQTGVDRLNDSYSWVMPMLGDDIMPLLDSGSEVQAPGNSDVTIAIPGVSPDAPVADRAVGDAASPVDLGIEIPVTEPTSVTLTSARLVLAERSQYDEVTMSYTVFLVPSFEFKGDNGGTYIIDAAGDAYVELPPQVTLPDATVPDSTVPDSTVPDFTVTSTSVGSAPTSTSSPSPPDTTTSTTVVSVPSLDLDAASPSTTIGNATG